jgi:hypothetical protein
MHGTPTHRRFEVLPEPVDLDLTLPPHDVAPAPQPWVGRDTELDLQVKDATRF